MKINLYLMKLQWVILRRNFEKMPSLLKFLTAQALFSTVFIIFSVIPVFSFGIGSKTVNYLEWWSSGAGISASIAGIVFPISGYLILKRNNYARIIYISSWILASLCHVIISGVSNQSIITYIVFIFVLVSVMSAYFYLNKSAKLYFSSRDEVR